VLVIVSFLVAMAAMVTRAITSQQRRSTTATRLTTVDAALLQFVMLQKRLPCPADGRKSPTNDPANMGREEGGPGPCSNNQQFGVVPWKALGLAEADILDGWDRRLTYKVDQALTAANAMDMSSCDPAGGIMAPAASPACVACTAATLAACTAPSSFLVGKGLTIQNVAGTPVMSPPNTAAAYVVISAGETGGGGMLNSGATFTSTTTDGAQEQQNYAPAALQLYYVDDSIADAPGATHFDDMVSRPTVLSVVNRAGLGPRSHP
jgi:hypothetical protein